MNVASRLGSVTRLDAVRTTTRHETDSTTGQEVA